MSSGRGCFHLHKRWEIQHLHVLHLCKRIPRWRPIQREDTNFLEIWHSASIHEPFKCSETSVFCICWWKCESQWKTLKVETSSKGIKLYSFSFVNHYSISSGVEKHSALKHQRWFMTHTKPPSHCGHATSILIICPPCFANKLHWSLTLIGQGPIRLTRKQVGTTLLFQVIYSYELILQPPNRNLSRHREDKK